jgi:integrase/recombinase XerD
LQAEIDAMPRSHLTFIVTAYGKPRSKFGLGTDFAKWATDAGLPGHCRLHGLKKAGMTRLANSGNTAHELMSISGHKTIEEVKRYTEEFNRRMLASSGMAKQRAQKANGPVTNAEATTIQTPPKSLKIQGDIMAWRSQGESNPCFRRERATS